MATDLAAPARFGLREVRIRGFRSARDVTIAPQALCALVGEANAGKSNILAAIWTLLEAGAAEPSPADAPADGSGEISMQAALADGSNVALHAHPPAPAVRRGNAPSVVFLPAELRAGPLAAEGDGEVAQRLRSAARSAGAGRSAPALALVDAVEEFRRRAASGLVLLIEEPELYLRPQAQRYLYRLLRAFADLGNQVLYSTHAPAFLNVARLEELALVEQRGEAGTTVVQPHPLAADEAFRAISEFDAERSELFLARAALLVEGRTEKVVFPFVFEALGHDVDREEISIVECGGKSNIPLIARVCGAARIPYVVVHDRDAPTDRQPIAGERAVNAAIAEIAPPGRVIVLAPDFEAVAGLQGHDHKPEHAWRRFASVDRTELPPLLVDAVERVLALARN